MGPLYEDRDGMGLQQPFPSEATTQALRVQKRILSFTQRNLCPPASTKGK